MGVDLSALDARIDKLHRVRELLADEETRELFSDPEVMALLQHSAEGRNGHKPAQNARAEESIADNVVSSPMPGEGTIRGRVLEIARTSGKFEAKDVREKLEASGYRFAASEPMIAVNSALRYLTRKRFIRLVRVGSGRVPHVYEIRKEQPQNK
jgi:hypothetical protein